MRKSWNISVSHSRACRSDKSEETQFSYFGAFTMDTIATCAIGTRVDSQKYPNNPFSKNARELFNNNLKLKQIFTLMCPKLVRILGFQFIPKDNVNFFERVTNQLIEYRQKNKEGRTNYEQIGKMVPGLCGVRNLEIVQCSAVVSG
ncbi:cytochrome P450 3A29-like [Tachypleus tridentatus]|uniref:cytochrome P450 3A29-like n=1 Tax=Tachypleus tridentatus TaxID=6853 RepID=UPI003FD48E4C